MSHNLKTLKIVAPRDGDLLLPTNYGKPGRLNTMGSIRSESARVYRRVCEGRIPVEDGTKLFYMLDRMTRMAEAEFLESRLEALEHGQSA
jgi:hypothetical protein|tara:strand:- start:1082 stop:1351 length:270 start_codon:yes stop_codon:yes gene_type:complete